MSRDRGVRLQRAAAAYLQQWWPHAESNPNGRNGTDILGTPGVAWEIKTAREFRPAAFVRQARTAAAGMQLGGIPPVIPVVVYYPDGCGDRSTADVLAILPVSSLMGLLEQARYTPERPPP
jgi:hypothetical protein